MSSSDKSSLLFSPLKIRGITLRNRICVAPMAQCSAVDGVPNDWHLVHYGSFAKGGAGLVMVEATIVEARGRVSRGCTGLWDDHQIEPWRRITTFLRAQGSVPGIQLAHGGRKASGQPFWVGHGSVADEDGGWPTIGASAVPFGGAVWKVPKEATIDDIDELEEAFVSGAKRAVEAGFEVLELHFAHGWLVSSFLSPLTNHRTDKYGGCLENRMRFGLEIAAKVRNSIPEDIVIGVRISVTDYADNGWDIKQSIDFAKKLKTIGMDFIDCSSGGVVSYIDYNGLNANGVQLKAAQSIQKEVGIATAAVGKIVDPHEAEAILRGNGATLIFIGRAFLNNPHWPYMAADVLANKMSFKYPDQYDWCIGWRGFDKWRRDVLKDENNNLF
ncbi:unnamed protein product [Oppiella nova]|uniref:NADH:flavin oxidoreductase/NADH oxidase N-terminal domain-containing protein n=1 Tax=Oppiella nova TaxID=334625 RepID=A0A7R9LUR0_9ACAR|nr:unnamed protein product [Oppiella nova]CAG2167184.1 unnamed protein product [Oppiella nova]